MSLEQIDSEKKKRGGARNFTKYPFRDMQVGDSFWTKASSNSIRSSASHWSKRLGKIFSVKGETKHGVPNHKALKRDRGFRVWRTS
jgi:hypothetical protein